LPELPPTAAPILRVALDTPLRRLFDYRRPPGVSTVMPGMRVRVPFGRQVLIGVVIETAMQSEWPDDRLRAALEVLDTEPVFDTGLLGLIRFAADYYHHPLGEAINAALPTDLRAGKPLHALEPRWRLTEVGRNAIQSGRRFGARQQALVEKLNERDTIDLTDVEVLGPRARAALSGFVSKGWIDYYEVENQRVPSPSGTTGAHPTPTAAQAEAIAAIEAELQQFAPFLLYGVTGSGKTEVYLRAIETVISQGRQALVLVPEIALTPQAVARFKARFDVPIAVLHSGLTDADRLSMWRLARSGRAPIVIGTRSAVFVPLARPGILIVDEEHDASYKQQEGFRYSARDLAVLRAQRDHIPVVLGSATPSLETLHHSLAGRYRRLSLPERAGAAGAPRITVIDLRLHEERHGIATPTVLAIERHLADGGQVLLYLNRRGYAPTLFCPGCSWSAPCGACDARMTVHMRRAQLVCHHCGAHAPVPYACPQCSNELRPVGQGTERIEDGLDELFPGRSLVRIDRDTIQGRGEIEQALERVQSGQARILVGTQMLTKGHDFPDVSLVVILNADQGLFGTDFRASERLAQSIVQVAGRAGRAHRPGEVFIQTACPDHPLLQRLVSEGYEGFAQSALAERAATGWPPYRRLALLRADAPDRADAIGFLESARRLATDEFPVRLLGPVASAMERRAGRYRAQLLVESDQRAGLHHFLTRWLSGIEALPEGRKVRWSIDVDPLEIT
jgi:primosomal protein N' (replication factor Y) (superfamily II helicase)